MTYYHIFNRGAHKAPIFHDEADYWRMLKLLYIANCSEAFRLQSLPDVGFFEIIRKDTLVDLVAYCLMPNHIHIGIKSMSDIDNDPRVTKFMRKLCTGYSNYYNKKYDHSGTIWQGHYKDNAFDERNVPILISYIHLNPYGIKESDMAKDAKKEHSDDAFEYSKEYEFSSLKDYLGQKRIQTPILCAKELEKWKLSMSDIDKPTPPISL
jgi:REP element-mobilizing transposase RayT